VQRLNEKKPLRLVKFRKLCHMVIPNNARASGQLNVVNGNHPKVLVVLQQPPPHFLAENTAFDRLNWNLLKLAYIQKAGTTRGSRHDVILLHTLALCLPK
jgi:hypothetical protein